MDDIINGLVQKCGLSQDQAQSVIGFLKENSDKLPELVKEGGVSALKDKIPGGLGGLLG